MNEERKESGLTGWLRFTIGLILLLGFAYILSRGVSPPGVAGEVLRHNMRHGIDATPLFYTEIEDSGVFDGSELLLQKLRRQGTDSGKPEE